MDSHQQRRPDGEGQTETVRRNQACRLEPDPERAGQRKQDQVNRRSDIINIMIVILVFKAMISLPE